VPGPATALNRVRVRARTAADDSFIERLSVLAFAEYSRDPRQSTLEMARAGMTWVAERDDCLVGFVVVRGVGKFRAELCAIAVEEQARGLGVGRALLARIERALARAGTSELTLHTADANASALELFSKRGFRTERRLPRFYRGVYDAWAMCKRIT
jgi:[ribosomal protein S18]-alanine N-acetyltransferase